MLAAGMWLGVMAAVWYLFKSAPGHPFRSIGRFRSTRRRIARQVAPEKPEAIEMPLAHTTTTEHPASVADASDEVEEESLDLRPTAPPAEPDTFIDLTSVEVPASIAALAEGVDPGGESDEMAALIGAVTAPKKPRKPRPPVAPPRGPRKVGRTTYVLVDDEGRPLV